LRLDLLERLNAERAAKRRVCLVRVLGGSGGEAAVVVEGRQVAGEPPLPADVLGAVELAHRRDQSVAADTSVGRVFLQVFNPPLRLVIVGRGPHRPGLVPMAALAGYAVTVVDPRRAFATDERFPDVAVSTDWPDEALESLAPTAAPRSSPSPTTRSSTTRRSWSAVRSEAFYIGALGSRRTHARRLARLREQGVPTTRPRPHPRPRRARHRRGEPGRDRRLVMAQATEALRRGPLGRPADQRGNAWVRPETLPPPSAEHAPRGSVQAGDVRVPGSAGRDGGTGHEGGRRDDARRGARPRRRHRARRGAGAGRARHRRGAGRPGGRSARRHPHRPRHHHPRRRRGAGPGRGRGGRGHVLDPVHLRRRRDD
jgi:xanthine dehydrogenase accessory factor